MANACCKGKDCDRKTIALGEMVSLQMADARELSRPLCLAKIIGLEEEDYKVALACQWEMDY